jgi:hypothetical protein
VRRHQPEGGVEREGECLYVNSYPFCDCHLVDLERRSLLDLSVPHHLGNGESNCFRRRQGLCLILVLPPRTQSRMGCRALFAQLRPEIL